MKVCVYGCGAIGSLIAARLAASGAETSIIARGAHLDAIRSHGLTLLAADGGDPVTVYPQVAAAPAELRPQDFVLLAMKSHSVPAIAGQIAPLLNDQTAVVTAANGLPWWYFYGRQNDFGNPEIGAVDPGRQLWESLGPERALGCVIYPAAALVKPGTVQHVFGDRFTLGEPDGSSSQRLTALVDVLGTAGFSVTASADIRVDIWTKLVANCAFNPVSVITGKTLGEMIDDAATCRLLQQIMEEVTAVASALQVNVALTPAQLLAATRQLGDHKTSMLQDFEAGRPLELGPIVGSVLDLGSRLGVPTPNLGTMYQLVVAKSQPLTNPLSVERQAEQ